MKNMAKEEDIQMLLVVSLSTISLLLFRITGYTSETQPGISTCSDSAHVHNLSTELFEQGV